MEVAGPLGTPLGLDTPAACSFPGEKARSWGALGEARPGQSSLSAGALRYRALGVPLGGTRRVGGLLGPALAGGFLIS